jgi:hypothetical protein
MLYVGNVNARPMHTANQIGCNLFLEMPPGPVLSDLAKESLSGVHPLQLSPLFCRESYVLCDSNASIRNGGRHFSPMGDEPKPTALIFSMQQIVSVTFERVGTGQSIADTPAMSCLEVQ